jgi:metal-responsive CopG/Arc/MetJ family transcriptional regulator
MSNKRIKHRIGGLVFVGVKMPSDLLAALDAHINSGAVDTDRSKLMRTALREKLARCGQSRPAYATTAGGAL